MYCGNRIFLYRVFENCPVRRSHETHIWKIAFWNQRYIYMSLPVATERKKLIFLNVKQKKKANQTAKQTRQSHLN